MSMDMIVYLFDVKRERRQKLAKKASSLDLAQVENFIDIKSSSYVHITRLSAVLSAQDGNFLCNHQKSYLGHAQKKVAFTQCQSHSHKRKRNIGKNQ